MAPSRAQFSGNFHPYNTWLLAMRMRTEASVGSVQCRASWLARRTGACCHPFDGAPVPSRAAFPTGCVSAWCAMPRALLVLWVWSTRSLCHSSPNKRFKRTRSPLSHGLHVQAARQWLAPLNLNVRRQQTRRYSRNEVRGWLYLRCIRNSIVAVCYSHYAEPRCCTDI